MTVGSTSTSLVCPVNSPLSSSPLTLLSISRPSTPRFFLASLLDRATSSRPTNLSSLPPSPVSSPSSPRASVPNSRLGRRTSTSSPSSVRYSPPRMSPMTSTDPFPKGGIDYHHEQDIRFNGASDHASNGPKVDNKKKLDTESSEEHARRPRQNSRIPIANLLCSEEPPKPQSEDRSFAEPETLPPIRSRHQYAYDGDLPTQPSSTSSTSVSVPPESHHYKFGPYSYRPHRSLVAIHEDDTPNKHTSPSSLFPNDYLDPQTPGETRRPSATYHDSFQPRHDPYTLPQSPFDHSKIKSFRDGDRKFAPSLRRDSGVGPPAFATSPSTRSSVDAYQESCHPYDVEHKARTEAKSDFALHQQNYGPYLDASPQLASATLFTPTNAKMHDKNTTPSSSRYVDAPAPPSPVALALTSYDHRHLPSSSSSHTPSPHEYIPQPHRAFQGEAIHPDHGPMTPSSPVSVYFTLCMQARPHHYVILLLSIALVMCSFLLTTSTTSTT